MRLSSGSTSRSRGSRASGPRSALAALLLLASGCGPRLVSDRIVDTDDFQVSLRRTVDGGEPVARGYTHPPTVSDVRMAHILANLEYENGEGQRGPVIRSVHVYPLAEALNQALQKAGPDDEVTAVVYARDRRLGLFTERRVTGFRLFFADALLTIEFFDIERELEPGDGKPGRSNDYDVPGEAAEGTATFRMLTGPKHLTAGRTAVQVEWRDPYFAQPVSLSVRGDRFRRRTVIMDSGPTDPTLYPEEEAGGESDSSALDALPPEVRDAQIRALDQLDALRRQGLIKETEFRRRRNLILQGKLDEAGYEAPGP